MPFEGAITAAGQLTFDTAQDFSSDKTANRDAARRTNQRAALAVDWASFGCTIHYGGDRGRVEKAALILGELLEDLGTHVSACIAGRGVSRL